jgi:FtsZ-binding cell division protein ZapB
VNAIDARLSFQGRQPSIYANNGMAGIKLYQQSGRTDWVIDISQVPGRSIDSFIIRDDLGIKFPDATLLGASVELDFSNLNGRPKQHLPYSLFTITLLYIAVIIIFTIIQHVEILKVEGALSTQKGNLREAESKLEDIRQQLKNQTSDLNERIAAEHNRLARYVLYTRRVLSVYARENEFWRLIFERILISADANRSKAKKLIATISRHLTPRGGRNDLVEPEIDVDIDTALDVLTDELKSDRLRELLGRK